MKIKKFNKLQLKIAAVLSLCFGIGIIMYSQAASAGVKKGLSLCFNAVIPSLFPFFVLSGFVIRAGILSQTGRFTAKMTKALFRLPKECGAVILISFTGGYPTGAQLTGNLLKSNVITRAEACRMLLFCINSGPAFVISAVGSAMLGSVKAGVIIYASLTLSSLIIGFLSKYLNEDDLLAEHKQPLKKSTAVPEILTPAKSLAEAVTAACRSTAGVCAWVLLFCCINALAALLPVSDSVLIFTGCLTEVTTGCAALVNRVPAPVFAAVLGWGGLAVHCQVIGAVYNSGIKPCIFFTARAVNGVVAALICNVMLEIFPCDFAALAVTAKPIPFAFSVSLPAAAAVLFTCAAFILDIDTKKKV